MGREGRTTDPTAHNATRTPRRATPSRSGTEPPECTHIRRRRPPGTHTKVTQPPNALTPGAVDHLLLQTKTSPEVHEPEAHIGVGQTVREPRFDAVGPHRCRHLLRRAH